jgi:hypothetical protein
MPSTSIVVRDATFTFRVSPNGGAEEWYWEITCDGTIVARGLAPTRVRAREDAIVAAGFYVERSKGSVTNGTSKSTTPLASMTEM